MYINLIKDFKYFNIWVIASHPSNRLMEVPQGFGVVSLFYAPLPSPFFSLFLSELKRYLDFSGCERVATKSMRTVYMGRGRELIVVYRELLGRFVRVCGRGEFVRVCLSRSCETHITFVTGSSHAPKCSHCPVMKKDFFILYLFVLSFLPSSGRIPYHSCDDDLFFSSWL